VRSLGGAIGCAIRGVLRSAADSVEPSDQECVAVGAIGSATGVDAQAKMGTKDGAWALVRS